MFYVGFNSKHPPALVSQTVDQAKRSQRYAYFTPTWSSSLKRCVRGGAGEGMSKLLLMSVPVEARRGQQWPILKLELQVVVTSPIVGILGAKH